MKRGISILLCVVLCFALAACNTGGASQQKRQSLRIGISVYDQYDTFISLLMEQFSAFARQKERETGVSIILINESANGSQVAQNNQIDSFIQAGCDIICVNLVDRTDVSAIINRVEAAGIPVLFFNRELVAEDLERCENLYYVGAEAIVSGQLQGQLVIDLYRQLPDKVDKNGDGVLQYIMLEGEAGHQDAIFRTEYSINTISAAGIQVERLEGAIASWSRARAEAKMTPWLAQYALVDGMVESTAIEVIFANNDDMALGAIDALEKSGLPRGEWPVVVGIDGTREGLAAVKSGQMAGTVLNNAHGQANALMELAYSLYSGEELSPEFALQDGKYIRLPYLMITPENAQEFINLYG